MAWANHTVYSATSQVAGLLHSEHEKIIDGRRPGLLSKSIDTFEKQQHTLSCYGTY